MQAILDYLKQSGERLDSEIAAATGLSLANVRSGVNDLRSRGVQFAEQPRQEAYGTVVVFVDLYGNKWDLVERPRHDSISPP